MKNRESEFRVRMWMTREAAAKSLMTSYRSVPPSKRTEISLSLAFLLSVHLYSVLKKQTKKTPQQQQKPLYG